MNEPFDKEVFKELASLEEGNFWFAARNRLIVWALERWFPQLGSFFEVGCGTGFVLAAVSRCYPGADLLATDIYPEALVFARERVPRATLFQSDARDLSLETLVDVAGAFDVVEHIDDDRAALASIAQCVRPGGGVLLTVPQHPILWSSFDSASHHARRYRRGELEGKVKDAGLEVVYTTSFVSLLLPALALARWSSHIHETTSVAEALRRSNLGGGISSLAMRAEFELVRRGLSLPVGGSRLVVARRRGHSPFRTMTS